MPKNPTFFAGQYRAVSYAYGVVPEIPGLIVDNPSGATAAVGTQTLTVAFGSITLQDGTVLSPLATTAPVTVGTGSSADTVTPSAVSNNTPAGLSIQQLHRYHLFPCPRHRRQGSQRHGWLAGSY